MLDVLYYPVSAVMWVWHTLFALVLGPSSGVAWALSVIFLVLTLRAAMIKPFLVQMRSARAMRALAPQVARLVRHVVLPGSLHVYLSTPRSVRDQMEAFAEELPRAVRELDALLADG